MKKNTRISQDISITSDKAKYDESCKRLLANKVILSWIMKDCLDEYKGYGIDEIEKFIEAEPQISSVGVDTDTTNVPPLKGKIIAGMNNEDVTVTEGTVRYDIHFFAMVPKRNEYIKIIVNVEAQNKYDPGYPIPKRGFYYCSRMISAQKGVEFEGSHYEDIKKVYSIWICMQAPGGNRNSITRYTIKEENLVGNVKRDLNDYDLMTVIMIALGNENDQNYQGIIKLLDVLFSTESSSIQKKQILQDEFQINMTKNMKSEVEDMCNLSQGIEERGIAIGEERGIVIGKMETLKNLMNSTGWDMKKVMEMMGMDAEEQEKYRSLLEQQ